MHLTLFSNHLKKTGKYIELCPPNHEICSFFCWCEPVLSIWFKKSKSIKYLSKETLTFPWEKLKVGIKAIFCADMRVSCAGIWSVLIGNCRWHLRAQDTAAVPCALLLLCEWKPRGWLALRVGTTSPALELLPLVQGCPARHREHSREVPELSREPQHTGLLHNQYFQFAVPLPNWIRNAN